MSSPTPPGFPAAAYGLLTDQAQRVLIVQPPGTGEAAWRLPGGLVEPGETPREALRRELAEELGLDRQGDTLLAVEWVLPRTPDRRARVTFLFGTLPVTTAEAARLTLQRDEVAACRWVPEEEAITLLHERHVTRLTRARTGPLPVYLEHRPKERRP
ncbi:NUDIX hydrolase [Streptomyces albus subsp. chlorinus]|uniref:NUDIX domain-containing protein n=1 Tax=Streptomyces albus TaxID=1888 RepID=UPI0015707A3D|nr:NUDIX hydrolase [Streptomyces albus]NSC22353.1 NUDIX hydrolase [Streptomyces albus subsp. chlorinus]